jgi:hypothetical protein
MRVGRRAAAHFAHRDVVGGSGIETMLLPSRAMATVMPPTPAASIVLHVAMCQRGRSMIAVVVPSLSWIDTG